MNAKTELAMNQLTQDALTTVAKAREIVARQIADLEKALDAAALDGTPWLLVKVEGATTSVYGEWSEAEGGAIMRGWLPLDAVPHHLCGAISFSANAVARHIQALRTEGKVARRMHVREFQIVRLDLLRRSVALYTELLA